MVASRTVRPRRTTRAHPAGPAGSKSVARAAQTLTAASARARREADGAFRKLRKLRKEGVAAWDATWELVFRLVWSDPPLYLARYATLEAFIEKELPGEDYRSVSRNTLVARCFTPQDEERHSLEWLELIVRAVIRETGAKLPPPAIDLDRLQLRVKTPAGDARVPARSFEDVRSLRQALGHGPKARPASDQLRTVRTALRRNGALDEVDVSETREELVIRIPWPAVGRVARVLAKTRLPVAR